MDELLCLDQLRGQSARRIGRKVQGSHFRFGAFERALARRNVAQIGCCARQQQFELERVGAQIFDALDRRQRRFDQRPRSLRVIQVQIALG